MALSPVFRYIIRSLREHHVLPQGVSILEIGEANWYGPLETEPMVEDVNKFVSDPVRRAELIERIGQLPTRPKEIVRFDAVKIFYDTFFAPENVQAIDFGGTPAAHRFDLNQPVQLDRRFEVVFNHGTAEHIFNIAQVFQTIHDWTVPGGMMIHESPFTGWIDHGFYNLQPTLFIDLAAANQYVIRGFFIQELRNNVLIQLQDRDQIYSLAKDKKIPENSMLVVIMNRGPQDLPFRVPIQGYYSKSLSEQGVRAWHELR
jgi:hypothetical protein